MRTDSFISLNKKVLSLVKDEKYPELARCYYDWGQHQLHMKRIDEGCFFLTQAYVLALENGMEVASDIHAILKRLGREE